MVLLQNQCLPLADITGGPLHWRSESDLPWIEIKTARSVRNRWLRLTWRTGLLERVCRPVVRCELDDSASNGNHDIFLPGAPFGRATFIFYVPAATARLLLSPANRSGDIRFQVEQIEILPIPVVFAIGASRSLAGALHAYGAALIGRFSDMRYLLRSALSEQTLNFYPRWLKRGSRPRDLAFDGEPPVTGLHVRFLIDAGTVEEDSLISAVDHFIEDLATATHQNWSIIVLSSPLNSVKDRIRSERVRIARSDCNNTILFGDLAPNDLVAEIPLGTRLHANALDVVVAAANESPETSLFYGDNDHLDDDGLPSRPVIRSGFDALLLQSLDYIGPSAIWRVGAVCMLNHPATTRRLPDPAAATGESLSRFIFRFRAPVSGSELSSLIVHEQTSTTVSLPPAAILIPTRDRLDLLRPCIASILENTQGNFQIVILDNESCQAETHAYFDKIKNDTRIKVHRIGGPFNFSRICNEGVRSVSDTVIVFLNNDTLVIDGDWLIKLTSMAIRPSVGAVGLKLLFPDGRVQHAGVIGGLFGRAGHFDLGIKSSDGGFFGRANYPHQLLSVTGACLAVMREKFLAVGGFDEIHLPIDLNDIDLCFRLYRNGWTTVQLGNCCMYHYESASRGHAKNTEIVYAIEQKYFSEAWVSMLRADPYFSSNLSLYCIRGRLG